MQLRSVVLTAVVVVARIGPNGLSRNKTALQRRRVQK